MLIQNSLDTVLMAEGEVFMRVPWTTIESGLRLANGAAEFPLIEIDSSSIRVANLPYRQGFNFENECVAVLESAVDGSGARCGTEVFVNGLYDWSLENGKTLQIKVSGFQAPHVISIDEHIDVSAGKDDRFFEALIASHRSEAELHVRFEGLASGSSRTMEVAFEPQYGGGRPVAGYKPVSLPLPFRNEDVRVTMHVKFLRFTGDTGEDYPFIFIANPEVVGRKAAGTQVQPRQITTGAAPDAQWFKARVPLWRNGDSSPLRLTDGVDSMELFAPEDNEVIIEADYGHTLMLRARVAHTMLLFVDGKPVQQIHVRTESTPIRLPASCLRGEVCQISVRDLSGSQAFLETAVLAPRLLTSPEIIARESRPPFPTDLTVRANHRYRALRAHLAAPVADLDHASLDTAFKTLDGTHETVRLKPLSFPAVAKPLVSIVIPAHNKINVTYYGLCAVLAAHNTATFEVIVVDDASTDETAGIEAIVSGIRVVRNTEAQRFIRSCNAGAAKANGEYVALLNNDTEVTIGWLDALIEAFDRFEDVGAVGSKLLYPDGTLQDAGGIIWGSGNPWNYGNGANPWDPRFCYSRQADYLSGAALMTRKSIWTQVGGLSRELEPMYFEDTDFAFKVRAAGYKTYFVPSSVVYHFEGTTSGTDTSSGFKRYQEVNRPKFKRTWARAYAAFGKEGHAPDLEKDRGIVGRVLFVDYTTPRPDRDAGSYAAWREIELVQSLGYKVTFVPLNLAHFGSYTEDLERAGVEMIHAPFFLSVAEFLERRAAEFDAVYITRYYVADEVVARIRQLAPNARIILNNADLHFLRELRTALSTNDADRMANMRRVRDLELDMMKKADVVLSYNEVEHSVIASHTDGEARVMTCPWVVDIPDTVAPLDGRAGISFLGSFNHHPNTEGVIWFCREVMPLLDRAKTPLSIYGSGMGEDIRSLAGEGIDPVGFVDDVADAYDRHRIFVAPLLSGAGIKGKVLSALAHGIPCVLSPVAAEGIGLRHGHDCMVVERPQDWADAIAALSGDDALWAAVSKAARGYAAQRFSFAAGREKMRAAFEAVDLFGAT